MLHILLAGWFVAAAAPPGEDAGRSLSWDEALATLAAESPDLAQAQARIEEAAALQRLTTAALLPSASVVGGYTRNNAEVILSFSSLTDLLPPNVDTSGFPTDRVLQPLEAWTASGQLSVPLLVPPAYAERAAAEDGVVGAEQAARAAQQQLSAGLLAGAAAEQQAAGVVAAAERAVARAQLHRDAAARAVEAGTQPPLALLQADTELARRRSDLSRARAQHARTRRALGTLLGLTEPVSVALPPADVPIPAGPADGRTAAILAAEAQADAAAHRAQAARLRALPVVAATAKGTASTVDLITGDNTLWSVGVEARWSLLEGGARRARQDQAQAQLHSAQAAAEGTRLRTAQAEADAEEALALALETLALTREALALAQTADAVAQRGLAAGTTSALDAQDAAEQVFQADIAAVSAQAAVSAARAELMRARGVSW